MKLADRTVEIHSRGLDSSNSFSIAQTSKMFKILSDSLYSDKVMAVIRELSTNAYDAHVASGNKNPFKVILPSQAHPSFVIRDYGTGLSQTDMEELYTTYGASNKNDSNDFVGCLGLGSKSPFAYTKSFSTTSYYNGKAYRYIAAMDENGVPSLNLFGINDTTEPNGLEISFAVKQYDFNEFSTKAKRIYHYFKMKPIVEGGVDVSLADHSYSYNNVIIQREGWKIGRISGQSNQYPSNYNSPNSGVVAIMGNIAYPVDVSKIIGEEKEDTSNANIQKWNRTFKKADVDNWKSLVREILGAGLYLEIQFNIGELEMDVSREGLQYTKNVIKTLREKTQDIYISLKEDMSEKLKEATNLVEAYITYYNLSEIAGGWTAGASWTDADGKVYELSSGTDLEYKLDKSKHLYVINFRAAAYRSRRLVYLTDKIHHETLNGKGYHYWSSPAKTGKLAFFRCDIKSEETAKKILTRYCNTNNCFAYLMIDSNHPEDSTTGFDSIIKYIGGENNVLKVSDYKSLIVSSPRSSKGSTGTISKNDIFIAVGAAAKDCKKLSGNIMNESDMLRELSDSMLEDLENNSEIIYVPIIRYGTPENYPDIRQIHSLYSNKEVSIGAELFKDKTIFAIKASCVDKLKKEGYNLVDYNVWFKNEVSKVVKNKTQKSALYMQVIDFCQKEYDSNDGLLKSHHIDYRIDDIVSSHIENIFGLNYRQYIKNDIFCDALDHYFMMQFFVNLNRRDISKNYTSRTEYYSFMNKILTKFNLNNIDAAKISSSIKELFLMKSILNNHHIDYESIFKENSGTNLDIIVKQLPRIKDIRNTIKNTVDKCPMLKYTIVSASTHTFIRPLDTNRMTSNPLKVFDNTGYYESPDWFTKIDNVSIENFRVTFGSLI